MLYAIFQLPADDAVRINKNIFPFWFLLSFMGITVLAVSIMPDIHLKNLPGLIIESVVDAIASFLLALIFTCFLFMEAGNKPTAWQQELR